MSIDGLRDLQLRHLTARATITRGTYPSVTTVATGVHCTVRPSEARRSQSADEAGGDVVVLPLYDVRLPAAQDVARDDVITITTSRDDQTSGRYLRVVEVLMSEKVATRVVQCEEIQS